MSFFSFVKHIAQGDEKPGGGVFGFLNQTAQGVINPISKVGNEGIALGQVLTGNTQGAQRTLTPGGGLGHQGGVLGGAELENQSVFLGNKAGQNIKKTVGTAASAASNILPTKFGFLADSTLGAKVGYGALAGAGVGATGAAGAGLADNGQLNLKQILEAATAGALIGGAAPIVGAGVHQFRTENEIGSIGKNVIPKPEDIHIQTNAGTIRISPEELTNITKAQTTADVKKIIGDALPQRITDNIAHGLAISNNPINVQNIISKGVNDSLPRPMVGNDIGVPSVSESVNPAGQGTLGTLSQSPAARQITDTLAEARKTRAAQEQSYTSERAARAGAGTAAAKELTGSEAYYAKLAQLKGPLAKVEYQGLKGHLSPTYQNNLYDELHKEVEANSALDFYGKLNTQTAVRKVIFGEGGVPTAGELGLLQKQFGDNFVNAVKEDVASHNERINAIKSFGDKATQVAGLPRELMATADFSGGLRQGLAAATRHPKVFAKEFVNQFKYFAKEENYQKANQAIFEHQDYGLLKQSDTAILALDKKVGPTEEQFVSNLAEKIPGIGRLVRASNRAYTGLLNNMRARIFYDKIATLRQAGYDFSSVENNKLLKDLGKVINTSTGRGDLGRFEPAGHALTTALFAPRLIASRLSMLDPRYYINLEPAARKEALTTLASLGAFATGILSLADLAGAKVSKDPTNADFGKVRIGDTRFDVLGGYAQYLRLGAQLAEGKKTNSTTGATTELGKGIAGSRWDVVTNFIANKEAPVPSFVTTALKGKDAAGNPVDYKKEIKNRFLPLVTQDIADLFTHDNSAGLLAAPAAVFGVGLQTYSSQDNPLSTKQKEYIDNLKQYGADKDTIKASTAFFQNLKEASGTRTNVNDAVDKAIASHDLEKAQQLADQYNKELSAGIHEWNLKYGQYANPDLQEAYNRRKIKLTGSSIRQRLNAQQSTKPF